MENVFCKYFLEASLSMSAISPSKIFFPLSVSLKPALFCLKTLIIFREQFEDVSPTDKIRPITAAPVRDQTHQNLIKQNQNEANQKYKFKSLGK